MSSEIIEVDPTSLRAMNDELIQAAGAIDTDIQNLTSELNYLMTQWSGEAAEAYLSAQSGWNSSMNEMHSVLAQITALVATIATRYETTESNIVSAASA